MAPPTTKPPAALARAVANKRYSGENFLQKFYRKYVNFSFVKYLIFDPAALPIVTVFILLAELVLNVFVINRVPYTEIDWKAYMQECEGFLNGSTNYAELKGKFIMNFCSKKHLDVIFILIWCQTTTLVNMLLLCLACSIFVYVCTTMLLSEIEREYIFCIFVVMLCQQCSFFFVFINISVLHS